MVRFAENEVNPNVIRPERQFLKKLKDTGTTPNSKTKTRLWLNWPVEEENLPWV